MAISIFNLNCWLFPPPISADCNNRLSSIIDLIKEANKIALAIASVLVNDYGEYYGTNTDTIIKVVNEPLVSDYPVRPNIITNGIVGLVIGLTISISWIIYQENKKTNYQNINIEDNETKIISMYQPINN